MSDNCALVEIITSEAPDPAKPEPAKNRQPFRFSKENARKFSEMGQAAYKAKLEALKNPPPQPSAPTENGQEKPKQDDRYASSQVARVRGHLRRLDGLLDAAIAEGDSQAIERLTRARVGLDEVERKLSDRSLPVVRRVAEVKTGQRSGLLSGLPDAP